MRNFLQAGKGINEDEPVEAQSSDIQEALSSKYCHKTVYKCTFQNTQEYQAEMGSDISVVNKKD